MICGLSCVSVLAQPAPSPVTPAAKPAFRASSTLGTIAHLTLEPQDERPHDFASLHPEESSFELKTPQSLSVSEPTDESRRAESFLKEMSRSTHSGSSSGFELLHKKLPSKYAHDSSTAVETGFSQLLTATGLSRSRASGAGVQEPEWLYLRMNLRF